MHNYICSTKLCILNSIMNYEFLILNFLTPSDPTDYQVRRA